MSKAGYSFGKLPTLSTVIWSAEKVKSWKWGDNRHLESIMQRFVVLNQKNLSYLGITASVIEDISFNCLLAFAMCPGYHTIGSAII